MKRTAHSCGSWCWGEGYSPQNSLKGCCKLLQNNWPFYLNTSLGAICRIWYCCLHMGATDLCISDVYFCLVSVLSVYSTYWFLWLFLLGLFSIPSTRQLALLWNLSLILPLQHSSVIECSGLLLYVRTTKNSLIKMHLEVKPVHLSWKDILEQLYYFSPLHPFTRLHPFVHFVFRALSNSQFSHEKFISEITVRYHFLKEVNAGDWTSG